MIKSYNTQKIELFNSRHKTMLIVFCSILGVILISSIILFSLNNGHIYSFLKKYVVADDNVVVKKISEVLKKESDVAINNSKADESDNSKNSSQDKSVSQNTNNDTDDKTDNSGVSDHNLVPVTDEVVSGAPTQTSGTPTSQQNSSCNTSNVWQNLESCGWPGSSNTGPSGNLTLYSSGLSINSPGTYSNLDVHGYLNINSSNVTVRNFKLSNINNGYTALRVDPSVTNVVLEDCEINPNFVTQFAIWGYDNITVRRCELYNNGGAIQARQNLVFEDNYCHDIDDVANDGDNWHTNCVIAVNDSRGVSNWRIYHNTLRLGTPGGLKYYSGAINTLLAANNTIENNLIANGAYSMYLFDSRSANVTPTNTAVRNNQFSIVDNPKVGLYGIW